MIPAQLRCRILFTTRQPDFPRNFQPFELKVLPKGVAMKLLLRNRPEALDDSRSDWGRASIVCDTLGWRPLELAAYVGLHPEIMIEGYLERLRTEKRDVAHLVSPPGGRGAGSVPLAGGRAAGGGLMGAPRPTGCGAGSAR